MSITGWLAQISCFSLAVKLQDRLRLVLKWRINMNLRNRPMHYIMSLSYVIFHHCWWL